MNPSEKTLATILRDNGYATCVSGKWQLGGGDYAIHSLGFDNYRVSNPDSNIISPGKSAGAYKFPEIYENGGFWTDDEVWNKYGPDIFRDYVFDFIDCYKNKKPFFVYWAFSLCHRPFSPTPDDADYASWIRDAHEEEGDTVYFPSMVKYMDKLIGQLVTKLNNSNLLNKTIIIFAGDNGTDNISSKWNGTIIKGQKGATNEYGTHVPMLVYCPGFVDAGVKDTGLINFTDFFPAICDIASVNIPSSYGILDGVDFAPRLSGSSAPVRKWIFCHYDPHPEETSVPVRWMQDYAYKKYDTSYGYTGRFYDLTNDISEKYSIPVSLMNETEKAANASFLSAMSLLR